MKKLGRPMKLENVRSELLMEITARSMKGSDKCTTEDLRQIIAEIQEMTVLLQTPRTVKRSTATNVHLSLLLSNAGRLN